ncbi:PAS domain S-box protein [Microcoleus sp. FACHB-SPT15]|uniref:PAS domain S-box protein n=1 Tax=Microcoleus sp. FACHB-SPT15 TaxID=2692830 RepID=UPI00177C0EA4|nr:PAS domain S-box protein [Microcoleus sp. FACHB-SPT15]MBD1808049.1 PAS domain S-box protein [Microcoleus sp. FACHB-SPT15]
MTSTKNLHLTTLQNACNYGVGIVIALITGYTPVYFVAQVPTIQKKPSFRILWLLLGGVGYTSVIWVTQRFGLQEVTISFTNLVTTVLLAGILWQRATHAKGKPKRSSGKLAMTKAESTRSLHLVQPQTSETGNRKAWLYNDNAEYPRTPIYDPQTGLVEEILAVSRDISEQKQVEATLRQRERQLQKLAANVPGMIYQFLLRTDGSVSFPFVSSGAREIYELEPTAIQQNAAVVIDLIHPDDRASFEDSVAASAKTLQPWNWEGRSIMESGKLKWLQAGSRPERQANGDILWDGVVMDVTERKQAEAALYESEELFRATFEHAGIAIAQVGLQGQFLRVNQKLGEITGYTQKELLAKTIWEITFLEDQAVNQMYLHQFADSQKQTVNLEKRYIHKTGSLVWVKVTVSVVRDFTGEPKYFISVIEDITQRKQAEVALVERSRLSTLAANVGVALASGGTLLAILQRCTEAIVQQLDATNAAVWTLNPTSQQIEQQAFAGQLTPLNPDLISSDTQYYQPDLNLEQLEGLYCSLLPNHLSGYPLIVEKRLIGVITLLSNHPLTEEAKGTLSWVANAIAVAVDRAWARSELLSRRESLLYGLANQIRNSLELDTILETAVQSIQTLLQIDRCHFLWYRTHESEPYWEVVNEARNPLLPSHLGQYAMAQVEPFVNQLLHRQIIRVDEVETISNAAVQQFLLSMGYTSILTIPVETQAGQIGVICCGHCTSVRPWDESEVELLQAVVVQLAIAIDQAELYAQARQAALIAQAQTQQLEVTLQQLKTTQAQLVQSAKMSSLGQLIAGIAHEINNPINFIHGNLTYASAYFYDLLSLLRLYQEQYPNPTEVILEQAEVINVGFIATDLPKLLSSMQRGSDRIRSIVLSLRNFSRLDEAEMKRVDLHEGIDSTLLILQHRLKPKDRNPEIQIVKEYGDLPRIECYPGQLNQVFINILSNAIEAFEQSDSDIRQQPSPTITIRTRVIDRSDSTQNTLSQLPESPSYTLTNPNTPSVPNTRSVVIQITDNGSGMTDFVKARIFDPFFTAKPFGQGTGLGLSISYQIVVEHHHGVLSCTSIPGQGSQFWIEIPIQQIH